MRLEGRLIVLRSWQPADEGGIVQHLNNRKVWRNLTDRIPHPYTAMDAREWVQRWNDAGPDSAHLAITLDDEPIGAVGFDRLQAENRFTAEIGYWLGEEHWGRGFATEALSLATEFAFAEYDFIRLQASVFEWNAASCRVLEKNRYQLEARLKSSIFKDDQLIDCWIYARLRSQ